MNKNKEETQEIDPFNKWGQFNFEKLDNNIDIKQLKLIRPILIDEPLCQSSIDINKKGEFKIHNLKEK